MARLIECAGIGKSFLSGGRASSALRDVDLAIDRGEFVAVTGPSGSGKSTLLTLIGALDRPTSGSLRIDGVDLSTLSESRLATLRGQTFGFVFQQFHLLSRYDIVGNVELPMKYAGLNREQRRRRARELLIRLGLQDQMAKHPQELSGGQQQRVAIARALANRPEVVLADEPTGALDSTTGMEVMAILRSLCTEDRLTVLMVTHDLGLAAVADRIVRFADGKVVFDERSVPPIRNSPFPGANR